MKLNKYCLVAIAILITACNGKDSNFWKLKAGSIESSDRTLKPLFQFHIGLFIYKKHGKKSKILSKMSK